MIAPMVTGFEISIRPFCAKLPAFWGKAEMNGRLAIVRAAHLLDYIVVLRSIGAPVDRDLARSMLPPRVEETPDLYISVPVAMEWLARCGRDIEPMELGFLGAQQASFASLKLSHQLAIVAAPTGLRRLTAFFDKSHREDNLLRTSMRKEAEQVRVICDMDQLDRHPFLCLAEWLNLQGVISIVRSVAGASWYPRELTFVSPYAAPESTRTAFANTRILVGQPHTSVLIDGDVLVRTSQGSGARSTSEQEIEGSGREPDWTFPILVRSIVQPYLNGGRTDLAFMAEVLGLSRRTLQRRLRETGHSYSELVQDARFELARALLDDPGTKIIDVGMSAGYDSPQHFARAFRSYTGITPTAYRLSATEGGLAPAVATVA